MPRHRVALVVTLASAAVLAGAQACSPEASRTRGGGPGADVGNHSARNPQPATPPALGGAEPGLREPSRQPGSPPGGVPPRP